MTDKYEDLLKKISGSSIAFVWAEDFEQFECAVYDENGEYITAGYGDSLDEAYRQTL